ncbi:MAG: hypothetical protein HC872_04905 [Gammaproteobacteria bacterium]|nr:hypothetical protein [Gammaproteobacteria bacterium]
MNRSVDKSGPCLDELVFVELARDRLRQALAELPARARHAFLLYRLEGWSIGRIAARQRVSQRVVERDLAKVVEHLTRALFERKARP